MRKAPFILRAATAFLALLLFGTSLLAASHAHAASGPEKSETCATCHLLPQGVKLLPKSDACQAPAPPFVSALFEATSAAPRSAEFFFAAIRGPPSQG
ncbi:hypothetical protein F9K50_08760 [bacterium]|nr:MAG: hypothetical protein F9K50_08760 [bacterium]